MFNHENVRFLIHQNISITCIENDPQPINKTRINDAFKSTLQCFDKIT